MKILKKDYKHGIIELIPENTDDLYAIYRVLKPGDKVTASTTRRIKRGEEEGRADSGERVKMILTVEIEELAFHGFGDNLRFISHNLFIFNGKHSDSKKQLDTDGKASYRRC